MYLAAFNPRFPLIVIAMPFVPGFVGDVFLESLVPSANALAEYISLLTLVNIIYVVPRILGGVRYGDDPAAVILVAQVR